MSDAPNLSNLSPEQKRAMLAELLRRRANAPVETPLSYGQRALWFVYRLDPGSSAYNVSVAVRIGRDIDRAALVRTFAAVVARHASLRSTFRADTGEPRQLILPALEIPFADIDARGLDEAGLQAAVTHHHRLPFDLESGPVCRAALFTVSDVDHVLLFTAHHAAIDGWSAGIIIDEVQTLYGAELSGAPASLPPLAFDYAGFVEWQKRSLAETGADMEAHWRAALAAPLPILDLPTDRPRPPIQSFRGGAVTFSVPAPVAASLQQLARSEGTTLFALLVSVYFVLLSRYSGQDDLVVGTPALGRSQPEFERIVGYFVNPIALRVSLAGDPTLRELLAAVRTVVRTGLANQDYPFPLVVERLQPKRDPSRSPVFQAMFNLLRAQWIWGERADSPLPMQPFTIPQEEGQFDIALDMVESAGELGAMLRYNSDLFDPPTMERLAKHFGALLESAATNPSARVSELSMLSAAERQHTLVTLNDTAMAYDPCEGIESMLARQAQTTPEAIAIRCGERVMRYAELDAASNQLAAYLRDRGVAPGVLVGVCLQRSPQLLVALVGVLKAGGAYVPLDPAFPAQRLEFMVEDAALGVILTDVESEDVLPDVGGQRIRLDTAWQEIARTPPSAVPPGATESDLAYVLYTSGSTGKPKGVQVSRRALTNFIRAMQVRPGIGSSDVLVAVTTLSFDIAGLELYLPLSVGATVEIATKEQAADGLELQQVMARSGVTVMQATPATWRLLVDAGWSGSPGLTALCGGEPLPAELAGQLLERAASVWNMYGPTETTIWSTVDRVDAGGRITVGRPIGNTQVYVVDDTLRPVPAGIRGEICIGGDGVALGYLGRPELTAERFVADPFSSRPGARLYRTGDLGRWLPDGRLDVLGRADQQVKVRGFRIELGEIEAVLDRHEAVRQSVAIVHGEAGDRRIVAYVSYQPGADATASDLRRFVRQALPDYMVPSLFVVMDAMPLTPNGKVDRRALPPPFAQARRPADRVLPRTPMERSIAAIWARLLERDDVSVHDNFFDIGGHSLLSMEAIGQIEKQIGVRLNPARFMMDTLEQISASCEQLTGAAAKARS